MAERRIGDREFRCDPLNAWDAFDLHLRLGKVAGPALPHVLTAFRGAIEDAGMRAIADVMVSIDTGEAKALTRDILETCEIKDDGGYASVIAEVTFGRDMIEMLECLRWAVEVQFGPFGRAVVKSNLWQMMAATDGFSKE